MSLTTYIFRLQYYNRSIRQNMSFVTNRDD